MRTATVIFFIAIGLITTVYTKSPPFVYPTSNPGAIVGASHGLASLQSGNGQGHASGQSRRFVHLDLTHGKNNPDAAGVTTIPHWSDSFTYNGLVYNYTMVGTDPKKSSATTVIPTVVIPIRFVFADGNVFDASTDIVEGQTPVQGIINSPLFQKYDFNNNAAIYSDGSLAALIKVGNTQYGDAFQRANFWDSVSTRSPNYHVLLGQPTVSPVLTVNVPTGSFGYLNDPVTGTHPEVDEQILFDLIAPFLTGANISAGALPIFVWGRVSGLHGVYGFHGVMSGNAGALQTFVATAYDTPVSFQFPTLSGTVLGDTYPLSHEILEWLNDPFGNNFTPGWDIPFLLPVAARCDSTFIAGDLLEVGDVVEDFVQSDIVLPTPPYSYHVTDGAFIDFFTRSSRSRSYNGQYSFFEFGLQDNFHEFGLPDFQLMPPSAQCTGHVEFTPTFVDFPGGFFTAVNGINNKGMAVGTYLDAQFFLHGFVFNGSIYSTLDFPGALDTTPQKINDAGMIVGAYDTSTTSHGFSYKNGQWTSLDFPGASDTEVYGVNSSGAMVGIYDAFAPVTHAFLFQNGQYQDIANPFGTQTVAFAINDPGSITGVGYTDPALGPLTTFILSKKTFSQFQFPGSLFSQLSSINNGGDLAGFFVDPDGFSGAMVTVNGVPYLVINSGVNGNNDLQQICGYTFDFSTGQYRGFIGTLPLQRNTH